MVLSGQERRGQHGETPCIRLRGWNAGQQQGRSAELQQRFIAAAPVSAAPGLNRETCACAAVSRRSVISATTSSWGPPDFAAEVAWLR